ncbi:curli production assembly/transport component CsgF [Gracilimonas sp. Q87]|uniref:curli production assembly/transport component CsgF n=1 Tax=Gracilimonas sp. Q87 TaxID=3384766 RepID=UPI0039844AE1
MRNTLYKISISAFLIVFAIGLSDLRAQDFVYTPKNPAFGGNPINFQWLNSSANTQNKFSESGRSAFERDPLADFEQSLQRQVLSQITRNIVGNQLGLDSDFSEDSRFEFGEFTIEVTPGTDGVQIRIFNILTGDETNITIPNFGS